MAVDAGVHAPLQPDGVSIQHHPPFEPPGELADGIRVEDVVLEGLAGLAELGGDVRLLRQVLAGQTPSVRTCGVADRA